MKLVFVLVLCLIALSFAQDFEDLYQDEDGNDVDINDGGVYYVTDIYVDPDMNELDPDTLSEDQKFGGLDEGEYMIQAPRNVQSKFGGRQSVEQYLSPSRYQERATLNSRPMQFESRPSAQYGYGTNSIGARQIPNAARYGGRF